MGAVQGRRRGDVSGCKVGPLVTPAEQWRAPLDKLNERVKIMAAAGVPPSAAMHYFDLYVRPVLAYVAQSCEAPPEVHQAHGLAAQRLLHFPHRALPRSFGVLLAAVGLKPMKCPRAQCGAALLRAATRHALGVAECAAELRAAREAVGSLVSLATDAPPAEGAWWRAPATVDVMQGALRVADGGEQGEAGAAGGRERRAGRAGMKPGCEDIIAKAAIALRPRIRKFVSVQSVSDALLDKAATRTLASLS